MASPDEPDFPDPTLDATGNAPSGAMPYRPAAALPLADPPVYRPRSLPVIWLFVAAFLLAAGGSALVTWLLLR